MLYIGLDSAGLHFGLLQQGFTLEEGGEMIINGPMGVSGVSRISTFVSGFVLVLITLFLVLNLINSRSGRAIMAVRDNKIAADSIGISTTSYKLMAFVISAAFAGMAGTLYGLNYTTVTATKFDFNTSILILVFVVLGGLGNIWGSIIAAALLTVLPEVLREVGDFRMLILRDPADRHDAVQQLFAQDAHSGKARHEADGKGRTVRKGGRVTWQCSKLPRWAFRSAACAPWTNCP